MTTTSNFTAIQADTVTATTGSFTSLDVTGGEGTVPITVYHRVTTAEVNAGHTLVTVPTGKQFRLIDVTATAIGGNAGTVTSVDIKAATVVLVSYAQANLLRSIPLVIGATGVTVLADNASFVAQPDGVDVTIIKAGTAMDTATHIDVNLVYALE